jgi:hypothetical protein
VDQLDEERQLENSIVMPRTMALQAGGPQVTTYAGFAPSYPFTDPRQAYGAAGRGQGPNIA